MHVTIYGLHISDIYYDSDLIICVCVCVCVCVSGHLSISD